MKVVIVTGGRDFADTQLLRAAIKAQLPFDQLWQGGAKGADTLAASEATDLGKHAVTFHANWQAHGKAAGPLRNQAMMNAGIALHRASVKVVVLAFPGGTGTTHAVTTATNLGLEVVYAALLPAPLL